MIWHPTKAAFYSQIPVPGPVCDAWTGNTGPSIISVRPAARDLGSRPYRSKRRDAPCGSLDMFTSVVNVRT